jgi:tRNA (cytosine34-C5)-methyltransferase
VLSGLLRKVARGLELVDIHGMYGVKGRRGGSHWEVCGVTTVAEEDNKTRYLKCYKDYAEVKENHRIKESMFPPSEEEAARMNLQYSMRILPHDQNSGGFFVALLRKTEDFEWLY